MPNVHLTPIQLHDAGGLALGAHEQAGQLGAAGANQTCQPGNLPFAQLEGDTLNHWRTG